MFVHFYSRLDYARFTCTVFQYCKLVTWEKGHCKQCSTNNRAIVALLTICRLQIRHRVKLIIMILAYQHPDIIVTNSNSRPFFMKFKQMLPFYISIKKNLKKSVRCLFVRINVLYIGLYDHWKIKKKVN